MSYPPDPHAVVIPFGSREIAEHALGQIEWAMRQAGLVPFPCMVVIESERYADFAALDVKGREG